MHRYLQPVLGALCLGLVLIVSLTADAQAPAPPKISAFAPAADLIDQVDFFLGRVTESLSDPADFDGAKQSRTLKDAHTLTVLGQMLAAHDEAHPLKTSAPALIASARQLALAGDQIDKATPALAGLKTARAANSNDATPSADAIKWEKAAALPVLMKQVPLVYNGLKRGTDGKRLATQARQSAGQAATLAAIAQASALDTSYAKTPEQEAAWIALCIEMRDAAGDVNSAVHAQDAARVTTGMKRLMQSCETCHEQFRH